jgi:transposase-like protein
MVVAVRNGASMRSVARTHHVSLSTVQWWLRRAGQLPLTTLSGTTILPSRRDVIERSRG